jgi:hypothetical protein
MKILKIACLFSGSVIVVFVVLWLACGPNQPSDAKLKQLFKQHRNDLERLVQMTDEDWQMSRIAPDFTWRQDTVAWPRPESEWGISKQRWDEYRSIFAQAGIKNGLTRREKSSDIIFFVWTWGIVPAGISVGYLHCGQPQKGYAHTEEPCIGDHDVGSGMHGQSTSYGYRYEKIAPNWYIYEESN